MMRSGASFESCSNRRADTSSLPMTAKPERTVKIDNLLTLLALVGSTVAFVVSWSKERQLATLHRADQIQAAAAHAIAKLDRWPAIRLSLSGKLQPKLVQSTRQLEDDFDVSKARDILWSQAEDLHSSLDEPEIKEEIDIGYLPLFGFRSSFREEYTSTLSRLREAEKVAFAQLQLDLQASVLGQENDSHQYVPARLGNLLRDAVTKYKDKVHTETTKILEEASIPLVLLIRSTATVDQ